MNLYGKKLEKIHGAKIFALSPTSFCEFWLLWILLTKIAKKSNLFISWPILMKLLSKSTAHQDDSENGVICQNRLRNNKVGHAKSQWFGVSHIQNRENAVSTNTTMKESSGICNLMWKNLKKILAKFFLLYLLSVFANLVIHFVNTARLQMCWIKENLNY